MVGQLGNRVLLVDDDPLMRKLISGYLVAAGYVVQAAVDGLDALGKLRAGPPDLIISDLNMPRMSGIELVAVVHKRFPQIPVMVISSEPTDAMQREVVADAYYHKSGFGSQLLLETVSERARKHPLRTAPQRVNDEPAPARWDGDGHYIIGCGDCLREFSTPCIFHIGRGEKRTTCVHCGKFIQFTVMDGDTCQRQIDA